MPKSLVTPSSNPVVQPSSNPSAPAPRPQPGFDTDMNKRLEWHPDGTTHEAGKGNIPPYKSNK